MAHKKVPQNRSTTEPKNPEVLPITITEKELERLYGLGCALSGIIALTDGDDRTEGEITIGSRSFRELLSPFHSALVDLYCDINNRAAERESEERHRQEGGAR